jgi:peptidoglycan/LPS O-acetylase OafA/YrhL
MYELAVAYKIPVVIAALAALSVWSITIKKASDEDSVRIRKSVARMFVGVLLVWVAGTCIEYETAISRPEPRVLTVAILAGMLGAVFAVNSLRKIRVPEWRTRLALMICLFAGVLSLHPTAVQLASTGAA